MLSDKEIKETNARLLCKMASQTDRRSNLQHDIDLRTSSQPGESKLALVSVNRMCTYIHTG